MTLVGYELKKLFRLPALWAFLALCLGLNSLLIFSENSGRDFFNETSAAASVLGQRIDENYPDILAEMPHTENRDTLLSAVTGLTDPFDSYDTAALSEVYEKQVGNSSIAAAWMRQKYDTLSPRVAALAGEDAAMDLYAGPVTHDSHQFLFGTLLRAISAESSILGVLMVLYLFGYEHMVKTELAVCVTLRGRRLWQIKAAAGIVAALLMFLALTLLSLSVYFSVWDYSGIWRANVSSQFNYIQEFFVVKPFLTWGDFTVAGYLAASLGLIAALTIIFCLAATILSVLVRNTYTAAVLLLLLCVGGISVEAAFSNLALWTAYELSCFQPVSLWMTQNIWFTESGISTILPWQEIITACMWLLLGGGGTILALRRFYRKDIA